MTEKEIEVDFDFTDPHDSDYHMLKYFIENLFTKHIKTIDYAKIAQTVIDQSKRFGICFKVADDSDPVDKQDEDQIFGFYSFLDLFNHSDISQFLNQRLPKPISENSCLFISERLVNVPYGIAKHMYEFVLEDLNGESFDQFVILSKMYSDVDDEGNDTCDEQPKKKRSKRQSKKRMDHLLPVNVEEGFLQNVRIGVFNFRFVRKVLN